MDNVCLLKQKLKRKDESNTYFNFNVVLYDRFLLISFLFFRIREQNRKKAAELLRLGKDREASSLLKRSVDVTHQMALKLIKECRSINVDCIVAPYEADSQLAYLNLNGIADLIISEDSDLLVFGCKAVKLFYYLLFQLISFKFNGYFLLQVLFKLDKFGVGTLIEQEKLHLSMNMSPDQFNLDKFRYMCILSGCDYLSSIPGVGLKKAKEFIYRSSDPDIYRVFFLSIYNIILY